MLTKNADLKEVVTGKFFPVYTRIFSVSPGKFELPAAYRFSTAEGRTSLWGIPLPSLFRVKRRFPPGRIFRAECISNFPRSESPSSFRNLNNKQVALCCNIKVDAPLKSNIVSASDL